MLPAQAADARQWVVEGANAAGRTAPVVASYVRVALGPAVSQRLRDEEDRYRNKNEGHRTYFDAMNVALGSVGVAASTRPEVADGLAPCQSVLGLPIVRVLAPHDATSLGTVATASAPESGAGYAV